MDFLHDSQNSQSIGSFLSRSFIPRESRARHDMSANRYASLTSYAGSRSLTYIDKRPPETHYHVNIRRDRGDSAPHRAAYFVDPTALSRLYNAKFARLHGATKIFQPVLHERIYTFLVLISIIGPTLLR